MHHVLPLSFKVGCAFAPLRLDVMVTNDKKVVKRRDLHFDNRIELPVCFGRKRER